MDDLQKLFHLLPQLERVVRREEHVGGRQQGSASPAFAPTPVDLSAMDLLTEASETLEDICYNCGIYYTGTWRRSLSKLIPRRKQLLGEPNVAADRERVGRLVQKVRLRLTPPSERILIGRCLNPVCGAELSIVGKVESVACPACGSVWSVEAVRGKRREKLRAAPPLLATPSQAAKWVREMTGIYVTRHVVMMWDTRVMHSHRLGDGLHSYDKYELLRLAESMNPNHK